MINWKTCFLYWPKFKSLLEEFRILELLANSKKKINPNKCCYRPELMCFFCLFVLIRSPCNRSTIKISLLCIVLVLLHNKGLLPPSCYGNVFSLMFCTYICSVYHFCIFLSTFYSAFTPETESNYKLIRHFCSLVTNTN